MSKELYIHRGRIVVNGRSRKGGPAAEKGTRDGDIIPSAQRVRLLEREISRDTTLDVGHDFVGAHALHPVLGIFVPKALGTAAIKAASYDRKGRLSVRFANGIKQVFFPEEAQIAVA
jgi:hypothetical protein